MKNFFFILLSFACFGAYGSNATFEKLAEVNRCWIEQKDVKNSLLPAYTQMSERAWIRTHLSLVETILRNRSTEGLTTRQQHNRLRCLDYLHGYWQACNFPINEEYASRTPIFIDKHDNFCAVGYLVKATGNEHVSRVIASKTNLAYVREMHYPELTAWAKNNGFTVDELAWIQPGYPPVTGYDYPYCVKVGNGVNGIVNEIFVDDTIEKMYVGGNFSQADGSIPANNIAYVTEAGGIYTWHSMGSGVDGPVHAIIKFDDKIFVAGSFNTAGGTSAGNIAYWDGSTWHDAGCVSGTVYDLAVFHGNLYACGDFDNCISSTVSNFAKWDGSNWQSIPGIIGKINTMEAVDTVLCLGGSFSYGTTTNITRWNEVNSFMPFENGIANEVKDIHTHQYVVYIGCEQTVPTDTTIIHYWYDDDSIHLANLWMGLFHPLGGQFIYNTMLSESGLLTLGGQFTHDAYSNGFFSGSGGGLNIDNVVNKINMFKDVLIMGGKFKNGNDSTVGATLLLNGLAARRHRWVEFPAAVPEAPHNTVTNIYPNPTHPGGVVNIENTFGANHYTLHHITGKVYAEGKLNNNHQLQLQQIPAGMYIVTLSNDAGVKEVRKIVVE